MNSKIQNLLEKAELQAESTPQTTSVTCSSRNFSEEAKAREFFEKLKSKLFQIREWNTKSGLSSYELFDENGDLSHRKHAITGDFIRLTLHGSGKSDWVKIFDVHDAPDEIVLTVKPTFDPTEKQPDKSVTSHFFASASTNNFCVQRKGETINFCVIGLDEKTNTEEAGNFVETVRNLATANVGFYFGIQKAEWKTFCENFLETA